LFKTLSMQSKSPQELLDDVLKELDSPKAYRALKETFPDSGQLNHHMLFQIIEKLKKDGFVHVIGSMGVYIQTEPSPNHFIRRGFEGDYLIKYEKGYRGRYLAKVEEDTRFTHRLRPNCI
jgi:hypothetical protein